MRKWLNDTFGDKTAAHIVSALETFLAVFAVTILAQMEGGVEIIDALSSSSLLAATTAGVRAVIRELRPDIEATLKKD